VNGSTASRRRPEPNSSRPHISLTSTALTGSANSGATRRAAPLPDSSSTARRIDHAGGLLECRPRPPRSGLAPGSPCRYSGSRRWAGISKRPVATCFGAPSPGRRLSARSALDASPRSLGRSTAARLRRNPRGDVRRPELGRGTRRVRARLRLADGRRRPCRTASTRSVGAAHDLRGDGEGPPPAPSKSPPARRPRRTPARPAPPRLDRFRAPGDPLTATP
jgi:hypothetical protein